MMNLKQSLNRLLLQPVLPSTLWKSVFLITAILGFIDATYLTTQHFLHRIPACSLLRGCEKVTTSSFSTIFGVPVALLGSLFYVSLIILFVLYTDSKKPFFLNLARIFTLAGFFFSLYLVFLQVFILKALCMYCLFSASTSTILFITAWVFKPPSHSDTELKN